MFIRLAMFEDCSGTRLKQWWQLPECRVCKETLDGQTHEEHRLTCAGEAGRCGYIAVYEPGEPICWDHLPISGEKMEETLRAWGVGHIPKRLPLVLACPEKDAYIESDMRQVLLDAGKAARHIWTDWNPAEESIIIYGFTLNTHQPGLTLQENTRRCMHIFRYNLNIMLELANYEFWRRRSTVGLERVRIQVNNLKTLSTDEDSDTLYGLFLKHFMQTIKASRPPKYDADGKNITKKMSACSFIGCATRSGLHLVETQNCGKCNMTSYCSRQCQKLDWPYHKPLCEAVCLAAQLEKDEDDSDFVAGSSFIFGKLSVQPD